MQLLLPILLLFLTEAYFFNLSLLALFSLLELISVDLTKSAVDSDVVDAVEGAGVTESENALTNPLLISVDSDTAKSDNKTCYNCH